MKKNIAVIAWVRCIGVFYSKPFENFIAPHATEYRYIEVLKIIPLGLLGSIAIITLVVCQFSICG